MADQGGVWAGAEVETSQRELWCLLTRDNLLAIADILAMVERSRHAPRSLS
jgi:hypothetical protein